MFVFLLEAVQKKGADQVPLGRPETGSSTRDGFRETTPNQQSTTKDDETIKKGIHTSYYKQGALEIKTVKRKLGTSKDSIPLTKNQRRRNSNKGTK